MMKLEIKFSNFTSVTFDQLLILCTVTATFFNIAAQMAIDDCTLLVVLSHQVTRVT